MGSRDFLTVAVKKFNWHVGTVLVEEADCLVTGLDGLYHVPNWRVFADEIGLSELGGLVVGLPFSCLDDVAEVFILQGIFRLVVCVGFIFLLVVVLISTILVDLWGTRHWVAVHIVVKLVVHFFLNG